MGRQSTELKIRDDLQYVCDYLNFELKYYTHRNSNYPYFVIIISQAWITKVITIFSDYLSTYLSEHCDTLLVLFDCVHWE
jgi:hypothetical protein